MTIDAVAPEALVAGGPLRDALLICDLDAGGIKVSELVVEARAGALPRSIGRTDSASGHRGLAGGVRHVIVRRVRSRRTT